MRTYFLVCSSKDFWQSHTLGSCPCLRVHRVTSPDDYSTHRKQRENIKLIQDMDVTHLYLVQIKSECALRVMDLS